MKLGPVTKLDEKNKTSWKIFVFDVMSENCDVIAIFRIFGQFGAVRRLDSGYGVCKSYVFSNSNLFYYKKSKQNWKISNAALTLLLWVKVYFWRKKLIFRSGCRQVLDQVLDNRGNFTPPPPLTSKRTPKKPTQIRVKNTSGRLLLNYCNFWIKSVDNNYCHT